ncbi:hypothetical protein [Streptomyces hirsutus]|uniref:hypothetical protein n=1 Tax=Streptomyces hirsutus TaxID=35620 RepID=UPI0033B2456C
MTVEHGLPAVAGGAGQVLVITLRQPAEQRGHPRPTRHDALRDRLVPMCPGSVRQQPEQAEAGTGPRFDSA